VSAAIAEVFRPEGALTILGRVEPVLEEGRRRLAAGDLAVDLSGLAEADSVVVAMLLDWQRAARRAGRRLEIRALPDELRSLATLYGVDGLLAAAGEEAR
jgi:phospholipid transport system transporter-binding protein